MIPGQCHPQAPPSGARTTASQGRSRCLEAAAAFVTSHPPESWMPHRAFRQQQGPHSLHRPVPSGEGTRSPQSRDLEGWGESASLGSDTAGTGFGLGATRPECQPTGLHRARTGEGSAEARHCGAPSYPGRVYFSLLPSWVTGWRDPKADHVHIHAASQGSGGSQVVGDKKPWRCSSLNGGLKKIRLNPVVPVNKTLSGKGVFADASS